MKRVIVLLFWLIGASFQSDNTIEWKETRLLSWDDFKGKPDASSPYKANTETEINVSVRAKGDKASITLRCFFNKNLSWVKENRSDLLLTHEQMHFNLTEVSARKFRQRLSGKTFTEKDFQKTLNALHSDINKESKAMQMQYDKETDHSVKVAVQEKWNVKISKELAQLKAFASPEVTCTLKK